MVIIVSCGKSSPNSLKEKSNSRENKNSKKKNTRELLEKDSRDCLKENLEETIQRVAIMMKIKLW